MSQSQLQTGSALPDLAQLNESLASNNDRIAQFIDSLPRRVDRMLEAATDDNWGEVRRISETLVHSGHAYHQPKLAAAAENLCEAIDGPGSELAIKRGLILLVSKCGSARMG